MLMTWCLSVSTGLGHPQVLCFVRSHPLRHQRGGAGVQPAVCPQEAQPQHFSHLQPGAQMIEKCLAQPRDTQPLPDSRVLKGELEAFFPLMVYSCNDA